jgi:hypothetical protein
MNSKTRLVNRRRALQGVAALGAGPVLLPVARQASPVVAAQQALQATPVDAEITDESIMTFVLNLEYLEAEYYLRGTTGAGIDDMDIGAEPGEVTGGSQVTFETPGFADFAAELAANELAHVRYYREALGDMAVDRPAIDLTGGFAAVAEAAGLGADFDPFSGEISFFLGGMLFEDVGVTGYKGATPLIQDKGILEDIAGVLAVEAYHMGMVRSLLYQAGEDAIAAVNAITAARGELNGLPEIEQGIEVEGEANVVPSDERGIAFSRTPQQVLQIVYLTPETGVSSGGFFPEGVNGDIVST